MKQNIEDFKEKLKNKNEAIKISNENQSSFYEKHEEQKKYNNKDYKPKKKLTFYGIKDFCPNCSKQLNVKYLGQKYDEAIAINTKYYIESCICGYEYVYSKMTYEVGCGILKHTVSITS